MSEAAVAPRNPYNPLVPELLFGNALWRNSVSSPVTDGARNRSFADGVPEQEFGNEGRSPDWKYQ